MENGRLQANVTSPHHILGLIAPLCVCVCVCLCVFTARELSMTEISRYLSQEEELGVGLIWPHSSLCPLLFLLGEKITKTKQNEAFLHVYKYDKKAQR